MYKRQAALGVPPLLDGAQLTLRPVASPAPMTAPGAGTGLLQLHAVAGPDTGIVHDLQPGRHHLGRGAHASIRVGDPSLSRIHAEIVVAGRTVTIRDLESTCLLYTSVGNSASINCSRALA